MRPWGVDVATGVETSPAPAARTRAARRFFEAARRAGEEIESDGWVPAATNGVAGRAPYDWQVDDLRRR